MRIVLSGATGFLGQNVLNALLKKPNIEIIVPFNRTPLRYDQNLAKENNVKVLPFYCDLADPFGLQALMQLGKPTHIIHLAGAANVRKDSPHAVLDNNIKATYNLLEAAAWYSKNHNNNSPLDFIFSSSVLVYGSGTTTFEENDRLKPTTLYGISKITCEQMIQLYAQNHVVRPRILRLCGIVGRGMTHGRLAEVVQGKIDFNLSGQAPGSSLPYISIHTAVDSVLLATAYNKPQLVCNISSIDALYLEDAIKITAEALDKKIKISWDNTNFPNTELYVHTDRAFYELNFRAVDAAQEIYNGLLT